MNKIRWSDLISTACNGCSIEDRMLTHKSENWMVVGSNPWGAVLYSSSFFLNRSLFRSELSTIRSLWEQGVHLYLWVKVKNRFPCCAAAWSETGLNEHRKANWCAAVFWCCHIGITIITVSNNTWSFSIGPVRNSEQPSNPIKVLFLTLSTLKLPVQL